LIHLKTLKSLYKTYKEQSLFHRYIHNKTILPLLKKLPSIFKVDEIGKSVKGKSIFSITLGKGNKKVLIWSQMHGNESTTTKAIFDVLNTINASNPCATSILENCTIMIIPILNPDGALAYTRLNANDVDLNRDAQALTQPESKVLRQVFNTFTPDFCFNLHGQRTIYNVEKSNNPATISFLAPAQDEACTITKGRKIAMEIISEMNSMLQKEIPNQVGIYDDAFNINCVGDTFQSSNVPTILFEAGHFKNDYLREQTRELIYLSLLSSLDYISINSINGSNYKSYFNIPKNDNRFFDIIIRNAKVQLENREQLVDIGVLYEERLINEKVKFIPIIEKISDLSAYYGHKEVNANKHKVLSSDSSELKESYENDFVLINNDEFSLNLK
jgi:hypothetical protein